MGEMAGALFERPDRSRVEFVIPHLAEMLRDLPSTTIASKRSPDERSDIRDFSFALIPHIAPLMRATC
jgi:hypothetical protein